MAIGVTAVCILALIGILEVKASEPRSGKTLSELAAKVVAEVSPACRRSLAGEFCVERPSECTDTLRARRDEIYGRWKENLYYSPHYSKLPRKLRAELKSEIGTKCLEYFWTALQRSKDRGSGCGATHPVAIGNFFTDVANVLRMRGNPENIGLALLQKASRDWPNVCSEGVEPGGIRRILRLFKARGGNSRGCGRSA